MSKAKEAYDAALEKLVLRAFLMGCRFAISWMKPIVTCNEARLIEAAKKFWKDTGK